MPVEERVFIAGAGPVGLAAAANLVRRGVPVTVFEAGTKLSEESRASTFHPPTLDMLDEFGAAAPLIAQGLIAPQLQFRTRDGVIATFDFGAIADATRHPFRLQAEQFKLTRILHDQLCQKPECRIEFGCHVTGVAQDDTAVHMTLERNGVAERRSGRWLIGADGATQRRAPCARHRIFRLHLAGAVSGRVDAVRFPQCDRGPGFGHLCRRSGALALPARNPRRRLARDVPADRDRRCAERRGRDQPRFRRHADGARGARHRDIPDRAYDALQSASARGEELSAAAASSSPAMPRISTIRSAAWA